MDTLPDELISMLFTTPACVFVCKRASAVLLRRHSAGLKDYYVISTNPKSGVITSVYKMSELPRVSEDHGCILITYGPPLTGDRREYGLCAHDPHSMYSNIGIYNVVAVVSARFWANFLQRLLPKQRVFVFLQLSPGCYKTVREAITSSKKVCLSIGGNEFSGKVIDGIVPWNSRKWPLAMWCLSLTYMSNVVTRKMYHNHFKSLPAGLTELRSGLTELPVGPQE